ncbi:hypothetical protein [Shewanella sp. MBTL60-007]|uniref:hypothetical protein n=1 Tax=Shewanella sp. MBTL60-007 TaxID=2815911 RepID=UPI001BC7F50E|nr:hypothetical protein [Shewanella sp. MBTL60-007]GIU22235.1 hypothetical protein TUM3792_24110 [Shewanella sp. MBTL60-007]
MWLDTSGFDAVAKELKRMREAQAPAIASAVNDAAKFGKQLAIDEIYNKYGFKSKSYIEQNFSLSINPKTLTAHISARYRPSSLTRFATPKHKVGKRSQRVASGQVVKSLRNKPTWLKGAFTFIGKNGNQVMYSRSKGDNSWRSFKEAKAQGVKALYGPSVGGSFAFMRDDLEAPIIAHLRKRYGQHAK